jgi:hypothetical protein
MQRCFSWLALSCVLVACGSSSTEAPKAKTAHKTASEKPRCPPEADSQPSDAQSRMNALQASIRQCFALGTSGNKGVGLVTLTLEIGESGAVKNAKVVDAEGAQPNAVDCCEKAARKAKFAKFCGDDANIKWTYTLE